LVIIYNGALTSCTVFSTFSVGSTVPLHAAVRPDLLQYGLCVTKNVIECLEAATW